MIDYKRLLCLKELLSLTMMCLSRDTLQCLLADKPNTELWVFKPVCASFTPLPAATHCLLPSRESQECLWEEKKQNTWKVAMAYINSTLSGVVDELGFPGEVFFQLHPAALLQIQQKKFSGKCLLILHLKCAKLYYQAHTKQWSWIWVFMPIYLLWFMWHWSPLYNRVNVRVIYPPEHSLMLHCFCIRLLYQFNVQPFVDSEYPL